MFKVGKRDSGLLPDLPRTAWAILGADAVSAVGSGLVLPFLIIYLRDVRHFPIELAGLMFATVAFTGLVGGPAGGWFVDHAGARLALMIALSIAALSMLAIATITEPWHGFAAAALFGIGLSSLWPATHSLMATVVPAEQRSAIYSVHFGMLNAGIGIGGIIGGLVVNVDSAASFQLVYTLNALSFVIYAVVLWRLKGVGARPVIPKDGATEGVGGYRQVLADRVFMRVCLLMVLLVMVGYAQLETSLPAFATKQGGISTRALGLVFAANTATIVVMQLFVLKRLAGRRRTRAIAAMTLLWAACWAIVMLAGTIPDALAAVSLFVAASATFALGETLLQATMPALVNDLAPENLRGRYNAAYSLTWSAGHIAGAAGAGFLLGAGRSTLLFSGLAAGCLAAGIGALRLERGLPPELNLVMGKAAAPVEIAAAEGV